MDGVDERFAEEVFNITAVLAEYCSEREIEEAVERAIEIFKGVRDDTYIDCITTRSRIARFRIYRTPEGLGIEKVKTGNTGGKKKKEVGAPRG